VVASFIFRAKQAEAATIETQGTMCKQDVCLYDPRTKCTCRMMIKLCEEVIHCWMMIKLCEEVIHCWMMIKLCEEVIHCWILPHEKFDDFLF
jgi:hypothetical protein